MTLDEIKKIPRHGKQPGNEGLMCEVREPLKRFRFQYSAASPEYSFCGRTRRKHQAVDQANEALGSGLV